MKKHKKEKILSKRFPKRENKNRYRTISQKKPNNNPKQILNYHQTTATSAVLIPPK